MGGGLVAKKERYTDRRKRAGGGGYTSKLQVRMKGGLGSTQKAGRFLKKGDGSTATQSRGGRGTSRGEIQKQGRYSQKVLDLHKGRKAFKGQCCLRFRLSETKGGKEKQELPKKGANEGKIDREKRKKKKSLGSTAAMNWGEGGGSENGKGELTRLWGQGSGRGGQNPKARGGAPTSPDNERREEKKGQGWPTKCSLCRKSKKKNFAAKTGKTRGDREDGLGEDMGDPQQGVRKTRNEREKIDRGDESREMKSV